jgi:ribose-phosphate pyrophosphokinase
MLDTSPYGEVRLLAGTTCTDLAVEIAGYVSKKLGWSVPLLERQIFKFANDNTYVSLDESVRGNDVFVIQTIARPVNDNLMELLIALEAVRRDTAKRITAVIPYLAYTRSDKNDLTRTPITARLVADLVQVAGADRYITIDLHSGQIQGFFSIPGDHLSAHYLLRDYVRQNVRLDNLTIAAIDVGFSKGARNWAHDLNLPMILIEKERIGTRAEVHSLVGDVTNKDVLVVDDEVDTAGSLAKAIELLDTRGAQEITVAFTHAVLSDGALDRLRALEGRVREFIFTNTIPLAPERRLPSMTILSVGPLLGEVIWRVHTSHSVGDLASRRIMAPRV